MKIKGVVFDIGQTLVSYPVPLNLVCIISACFRKHRRKNGFNMVEAEYTHIGNTLSKYNTRINPRECEVSSDQIFTEILKGTAIPLEYLAVIKRDFYSFFRNEVRIYEEVPETLKALRGKGITIGTLSDVAYGMDNQYTLEDIEEVMEFIDIPFTSNDVGYRKPSSKGLELLSEKMNIPTSQMLFVGDEKKDIECGLSAGAVSVLINRSDEKISYGQDFTIRSLNELLKILD